MRVLPAAQPGAVVAQNRIALPPCCEIPRTEAVGLRRSEVAALAFAHIQQRAGRTQEMSGHLRIGEQTLCRTLRDSGLLASIDQADRRAKYAARSKAAPVHSISVRCLCAQERWCSSLRLIK